MKNVKENLERILAICNSSCFDTAMAMMFTAMELYIKSNLTATLIINGEEALDRHREHVLLQFETAIETLTKSMDKEEMRKLAAKYKEAEE
jgi:organic hydroperoxide reductase OsmC/OhrA